MKILKWVDRYHLQLVKLKVDGAVRYGFGLVSEQSVHEIVSGIRDAINRVANVLILVIICSNLAVFRKT
jgi:hypothetical protein